MKPKVIFENVSKKYTLYRKQSDKLLDALFLKKSSKDFYALKNISFEVYEGETIGVIGMNGSGKSTLSSLLSMVVPPTSGEVTINGKPSLIAISAGLKPGLTGLENIELKCLMHGLSKEEIVQITPKIIEFADVGEFISQPVKNYSSGMKARLGFAIAINTNPDILIVDEALSVGDQTFYEKCMKTINSFKSSGKTIFYISHSLSQASSISDRVMWINHGLIEDFGDPKEVVNKYKNFIKWFNNLSPEEQIQYKKEKHNTQKQNNDLIDQKLNTSNNTGKRILNRKRKLENKKYKKTKLILFLQVFILSFFVILSATKMMLNIQFNQLFENWSASNSKEMLVEKEKNSNLKKNVSKVNIINKPGMISIKNADLYMNKELSKKGGSIPFSKIVVVKEEIDNAYKIQYENRNVYTNINNIELLNDQNITAPINLEQILPLLPKEFTNSYYFYIAYLNISSDEIKNNLHGLTDESTDTYGNGMLIYGQGNIIYHLTKNKIAESVTLNSLNYNKDTIEKLKNSAVVKSETDKLYFIAINQYDIILDLGANNITIIPASGKDSWM
jgi:teichoic acid transport system ATP-binding protein